jgi:hypothetical protein
MALSPQAIREVDSVLESISSQTWNLPPTFPNARLHALLEDLGLNIPSVGELLRGDYPLLDSNSQRRRHPRDHRTGLLANGDGKAPQLTLVVGFPLPSGTFPSLPLRSGTKHGPPSNGGPPTH